ncbi:MAG: hypothetical protein V3V41_01645, partial [Candidatus Heimdallarchaeota archaeon]
ILSNQLSGKITKFADINKMVMEGYLPEELLKVLEYSYEELSDNKEKKKDEQENQITLVEKMIWLFIRESQYIDTISFNLPESSRVMEHIIEAFERYQDVQGVAENVEYLFQGIQDKYFSN